jgi:hypothetical protein
VSIAKSRHRCASVIGTSTPSSRIVSTTTGRRARLLEVLRVRVRPRCRASAS